MTAPAVFFLALFASKKKKKISLSIFEQFFVKKCRFAAFAAIFFFFFFFFDFSCIYVYIEVFICVFKNKKKKKLFRYL